MPDKISTKDVRKAFRDVPGIDMNEVEVIIKNLEGGQKEGSMIELQKLIEACQAKSSSGDVNLIL